jgi:hypothetical protein
MPGLAMAAALLECGASAITVRSFLCDDLGLSTGQALMVVEAARRSLAMAP